MCVYAALVYYFLLPGVAQFDNESRTKILLLLLTTTVALPAASVFTLVRMGFVNNMQIEEQHKRNWPLLQTAIIYLMCFFIMKDKQIPHFIVLFVLGAMISMVLALLVNLKWKISLHAIGMGGCCGGILALFMRLHEGPVWLLALLFVLAGALGTARLHLRAHTPAQVYAGFALGFFVQWGLLFFLLQQTY